MNYRISEFDDIPREVVVTSVHYQERMLFPLHTHRRGQFVYVASGRVTVYAPNKSWLVPENYAFWVPAGIPHEMDMRGRVTILNTYVSPIAAQRLALPAYCKALNISDLLRSLLLEAADIPRLYKLDQREGRVMALLLDEIAAMPELPLHVPLPKKTCLARVCREFIECPRTDVSIDKMAAMAGVSRRTLTRLFRQETGLSFAAWKQQACLLAAMTRMAHGEPITRVAMDLGYSSPSTFTVVFRRVLGEVPSRYLGEGRTGVTHKAPNGTDEGFVA